MSGVICGIDPGQKGGVAFLLPDKTAFPRIEPMPKDLLQLADWLEATKPAHVFIEKAQSMPRQGISSAFNYGCHFGELRGIMIALQIPYTLISPRVWTRTMHLGAVGDTKAKSLEAARRLFPGQSFLPEGTRCKKAHSGMYEAVLIAEWGRRSLANIKVGSP